jgi:predicted extracellular nuclease
MLRFLLFLIAFIGVQNVSIAQEKAYKVGCIGFYNLENLFDTLDTPNVRDTEFTPNGDKLYGTSIYSEKLEKLASVVSQVGTELTPDGLAILGVSEIENRSVLEDFVRHPLVKERNYQIVHFDSPDKRGIDVGMIYHPKYFKPVHSENRPLMIYKETGERIYTRDILYVAGEFDGEMIHVMVNHWPSRRGGEKATQHLRNAGAMVCKQLTDSLLAVNPQAKVFIMGDLNDDPVSPSVKKVLNAKGKTKEVREGDLFNPWYDMYKKGYGTLAYRDAWSLFDQIIVSEEVTDRKQKGYFFHKAKIFKERHMLQKSGRFKGYPYRTFVGDTYMGGYSDHFPVYMFLLKEVDR